MIRQAILKTSVLFILFLSHIFTYGQKIRDKDFIEYPFRGHIILTGNERIKVNGLSYINLDSVKLFPLNATPRPVLISGIKQVQETKHAFTRGALAGAVIGFGLGYLGGYLSYKDKFELSDEDNKSRARTKGLLIGLGSAVPCGVAGALFGGVFIRKTLPINGDKEKLRKALDKIY